MTDEDKYNEENIIGDENDLYGKTLTVHSKRIKKFGLNEDFKLSDLGKNNQIVVRRSLVLLRHIMSYLDYTRHSKTRKAKYFTLNGEKVPTRGTSAGFTDEEIKEVENIALKITGRLMDDLSALAILSSAADGRIIKAIVHKMKQLQEKDRSEESFGDKLKPKEQKEEGLI